LFGHERYENHCQDIYKLPLEELKEANIISKFFNRPFFTRFENRDTFFKVLKQLSSFHLIVAHRWTLVVFYAGEYTE
jgi:hypothetical protein